MGLDTVELIYKVEEHFKLPIPDWEAEQMVTIRHICDYISKISNADTERKAQIEQEILCIVANHSGMDVKGLWLDMSVTSDLGFD